MLYYYGSEVECRGIVGTCRTWFVSGEDSPKESRSEVLQLRLMEGPDDIVWLRCFPEFLGSGQTVSPDGVKPEVVDGVG